MGTDSIEMEQRSSFSREYHGAMVGSKESNAKRHYKKDSRSVIERYFNLYMRS